MTSVSLAPESADAVGFGVTASTMQTNINVGESRITGTLNEISDGSAWTSGTWSADESTGYYIFLKAINVPEDTDVTVELVNGVHGPVQLDSDLNIIIRVTNKNTQKIKVTCAKGGYTSTKIYTLDGLVFAEASDGD